MNARTVDGGPRFLSPYQTARATARPAQAFVTLSGNATTGVRRFSARARTIALAVATLWLLWLVVLIYHVVKPLPDGVSVASRVHESSSLEFLYDLTYRHDGEQVTEQAIFDRIFAIIDEADEFLVVDMFLFNSEHGGDRPYRPLSQQLTDHLITRKLARPDVPITFITDEINNFYGAYVTPEIVRLREHDIDVVTTRLSRLRDSNPVYSAGWRILPRWFGTGGPGVVPHPLSSTGRRVTVRSYLKLLNFKANHRKLLVTEDGCLVTSANPHDASSFHSNIAFVARGELCGEILQSERAIASFSDGAIGDYRIAGGAAADARVQFITEGKIRDALLQDISSLGEGDHIDLAMFYLSERNVIKALLDADRRGVMIRAILDPNKDAFGREKGGIPNRQVAWELVTRSHGRIAVRWFDTHGEQFHTKLVVLSKADSLTIFGGSANLTRRNIGDYNLEADLRVVAPREAPVAVAVADYFQRIWSNRDGHFTVDFTAYEDAAWLKRLVYRFQEFSGFSSF